MSTGRAPAEVVIGLDVGTTAAKAVAFGVGTGWRHTAVREYPLLEPQPGWQVQDVDGVLAATTSALAEAASAAAGARVLAVALSTAMHGLVGLGPDMTPRTPLVTWADGRAREETARLRAGGRAARLHRVTGTPVHPMSPLTKLMWFSRHEPETCAGIRWWAGLKDVVVHALTGSLVTELSSASGTGLLDLRSRSWDEAALDLAGIRAGQLPPVLPPTATLGLGDRVATRVGLPGGTPVVLGVGDGPAGNVGTGALGPGVAGLSLGTSGAVRLAVPAPPDELDPALFCYAVTDDTWVVGSAVSNGGSVVRWAGQALAPELTGSAGEGDEVLLRLAGRVPPGADGLVMLPHLLPERGPLWNPDLPGAYLGLRRGHTRAHLVRAAVEGVALQLAAIVDTLDRVRPVTEVRVTGGAFRSPLWTSVLASALGRPLTRAGGADGTARGAAAVGLLGLGRAASLAGAVDLLAAGAPDAEDGGGEVVEPDPAAAAAYARLRSGLPVLLAALAPVAGLLAGDVPVSSPA